MITKKLTDFLEAALIHETDPHATCRNIICTIIVLGAALENADMLDTQAIIEDAYDSALKHCEISALDINGETHNVIHLVDPKKYKLKLKSG